jgi:effector-binding domain-containing protein
MRKLKVWFVLLLAAALSVLGIAEISTKPAAPVPPFTIGKVEPQVVLYTLHRGSYDKTGATVGKLFALAGQKSITPRGPLSYAYLNNPQRVSSEHWLTEIRIPVGKEALQLSGTLGDFTDVKTLPAAEVAIAIKPQGQADPGPIYDSLYTWIFKQGYMPDDGAYEVFLSEGPMTDYSQMKTKIMVPIVRLSRHEK